LNPEPVKKADIHFTIISILYNSEQWLETYCRSIIEADYDKESIDLILLDNAAESIDNQKLGALRNKLQLLNRYRYLPLSKNYGFGKANNIGAESAKTEYLFFLNIDTELHKDCLTALSDEIRTASEKTGLWECRQLPYEHPKYYNPADRTSPWSSGACFVICKSLFLKLGGFDRFIHMYCEDVELSWRLRLHGYQCRYVPKAMVYHYAYAYPGEIKSIQQYFSLKNSLYLRFKYGSFKDAFKGILLLLVASFKRDIGRKKLLRIFLSCTVLFLRSIEFRYQNRDGLRNQKFEFYGTDYAIHRKGAFYRNDNTIQQGPLVSVIIRTVGRPDALREALRSVLNQTYGNFEVIVVEDGSQDNKIVLREFDDDRIKYFSTGHKVGRCKAGNMGLSYTNGEFVNFLDDDDLFFADHLETLINAIVKDNADAAYSLSFITPQIIEKKPYQYKITGILHGIEFRHNRFSLHYFNQFPIQSVLFSKYLYEEYGGFDENLKYLEDWDLWLRYSEKWRIAFVEKTTTLFRIPGDYETSLKRTRELEAYHEILYRKYFNKRFNLSGQELIELCANIFENFPLKEMRHELDNVNTAINAMHTAKLKEFGKNIIKIVQNV